MHRLERQAHLNSVHVTRREAIDAGYGDAELARFLVLCWEFGIS
ncbi:MULTISPECIES: hypothetical protein [Mumia]|nr:MULTISPECIES: hypothetical protein [unclassified Mumia]